MILTPKQISIINLLIASDSLRMSEEHMDLDQIIEQVPYEVTKEAIQFSLRSLVQKGMINKSPKEERIRRRGRKRVVYWVTDACSKVMTVRRDVDISAIFQ